MDTGTETAENKVKQIIPVGRKVLVRQDEAEKKLGRGGIIDAPDSAQNPPNRGEIISTGSGFLNPALPHQRVGTKILYAQYGGAEVSDEFDDGRVYKILDEEDILAVVQ